MSLSETLYQRAQKSLPGGVNSPVRAFKGVGGYPIFFKKGEGAYLTDVDGKKYIDYVGSWGPLILGHCHPEVLAAVQETLKTGMSFGAPTELEIQLAELVKSLMPNIEQLRLVNSGTEATMTAIRLARGYTNRNKFIKFKGCYHGHSDSLLVKAGSGLLTLGIPSTPGIPASVTEHTLLADFNNLEEVEALFQQYGEDIAAIILEPVPGNMGFIMPKVSFLKGLREVCDRHGALLIFDEVMTGFRVALGGAQSLFDIKPDITTLGKVIGGGMPVGALGGRTDIMKMLAPEGPVYQAGTLSGNPLAMAAGLATLNQVKKAGFYEQLTTATQNLLQALSEVMETYQRPFQTASLGGMFGFYFSEQPEVNNYADVAKSDEVFFKAFYHAMLDEGIYFAPSMYEAGFVSIAHGPEEIRFTQEAADRALKKITGQN